jgi:hypothetical protein
MCLMCFKLAIYLISLICFLVSLEGGCESKSGTGNNPVPGNASPAASVARASPAELKGEAETEAGPASGAASVDACALIEKSEIAAVQGVEVQRTEPTSQKHGELAFSQCYYAAMSADGSKNLSVFIQVIRPDPKSAGRGALKVFWEERFGRESQEKRKEERGQEREHEREEEEEAIDPPVRVSGVGDKAFWLGSSRGGALYVLKKDRVLRVTAGGAGDAKTQIEKSMALAKKALARLM